MKSIFEKTRLKTYIFDEMHVFFTF